MGIAGLIPFFIGNHHTKAVISHVASRNYPSVVHGLDWRPFRNANINAPMKVLIAGYRMYPITIVACNIVQPRKIKRVVKSLPVPVGFQIDAVAVGLFSGRKQGGNHFRKRRDGQACLQDIVFITVRVLFRDFLLRQIVLKVEKLFNLVLYIFKSESAIRCRKIPQQFKGVVADFSNTEAITIVSRIFCLIIGKRQLQICFQFRIIEVAVANVLLIRHIGSGDIGGLEAGNHSGTGGQSSGKQNDDQSQQRNRTQRGSPDNGFFYRLANDLSRVRQDILREVCALFGFPRCLRVFSPEFPLLNPLFKIVFPLKF